MRLDIVMPAHNEQERIDRTLRAYRASASTARRAPRTPIRSLRRVLKAPPRAAGDRAAADDLLDRAEALEKDRPSYYGVAWVALARVMLDTDWLGGCG